MLFNIPLEFGFASILLLRSILKDAGKMINLQIKATLQG